MAGDTRFPGWCCRQIAAQLSQALFTMADLHAQVSDLKEENRQLKVRIGNSDFGQLMENVPTPTLTEQRIPINMATPRIERETEKFDVKQGSKAEDSITKDGHDDPHESAKHEASASSVPVTNGSSSQTVVLNVPLPQDMEKIRALYDNVKVGGDYKCDRCSSSFPTADLLTLHHAVHISRSFHVCKVCNAMFLLKADLYRHWATHPNVKQYICDLCGKAYTSKNNYKLHVKTHTGEGLYPCEVCGKPFHSENHLNVHRRTHTGERPYVCQYCDKSFTQKSGLINHTRLHTGEKPFLCPSCPKAFTQKSNLNFHLSKHHPPHHHEESSVKLLDFFGSSQ